LEFPRDLITPDPNTGHKHEIIRILFEKDSQDWELKLDEKAQHNRIENGYQVELLPEQDKLRFSLMKKGKPETEARFKITIPRLKWRTSKNKRWYDRPLQIKRDELIAGTDFYLTVCTNDFNTKYDLSAILETNGQRLQEAKFIRKGMVYNLLLNQFYDTIKKNNDKITLRMEIRKAKNDEILGQVDVIHLPEITKEKPRGKPLKQPVSSKRPKKKKGIKNMRPNVRGGKGMRKGKGFSRQEIIKAGINMGDIRRLHISFDKRRKSVHSENVETLKSLTGGE
jgi:ribosomal protein L13E